MVILSQTVPITCEKSFWLIVQEMWDVNCWLVLQTDFLNNTHEAFNTTQTHRPIRRSVLKTCTTVRSFRRKDMFTMLMACRSRSLSKHVRIFILQYGDALASGLPMVPVECALPWAQTSAGHLYCWALSEKFPNIWVFFQKRRISREGQSPWLTRPVPISGRTASPTLVNREF